MSLKARQRQQADALADVLAARRNHHAFIERWLPRLARDPFYNRNLSLTDPFKPEHVAPIDWDGNFHDRPRILGVPLTGGAGEYRLLAPLRAIGQAGLAQTMIVEPPRAFFVRILTPIEVARAAPDTLILHQPLDDAQTEALEGYARFARLPRPEKSSVAWPAFVRRLEPLYPTAMPLELPAEPARFDPGQIEQVLINLLKNAAEAGGPLEEVKLSVKSDAPRGVFIAVEDRGLGMSDEVMKKALVPFFTTKPAGAGLGLPLSRQIIEAHGGTLVVQRRHGGGTSVTCWLPAE